MHLILWLTCGLILFITSTPQASSDESPGFFLKITKNVPRLGRRSDKAAENYFFKNMKTIPRIGRSGRNPFEMSELVAWFAGDQQSPQLNKRRLPNADAEIGRELSMVQPVNANTLIELLDKDAIPSENVKFVHWKDFDRALQLDAELYGKVISLGRKPDYSLKKDLNFGGYVPLFGNSNDGGTDFMFYNRGDQDRYSGKYEDEFLHYNHLK